jgi:hypothetical protein
MTYAHTIFVWWGINATEEDNEIWYGLQAAISQRVDGIEVFVQAWGGHIDFIEVQTQVQWDELASRLEGEGYIMQRGGSGGLWRMSPWTKAANESDC